MDGSDLLLGDFRTALTTSDDPHRVIGVTYPTDRKLSIGELADYVTTRYLAPLSDDARGYVLVSQSFSGHVAFRLARRTQPGRLAGHVFVNAFAEPPGPRWLGTLPMPNAAFRLQPPPWLVSRAFLGQDGSGMDVVQQAGLGVSADVMSHRLALCLSEDSWHVWRRQDLIPGKRTLYLRGCDDWIVRDNAADKLRTVRSDVHWVDIERGPHLLLQRCGAQCAEAVDAFCRKIDTYGQQR